jgi:addiction module HigA family antidote
MEPLNLTQRKLAELLHVSQRHVSALIHDKRSVTIDTALRLSKLFGNSPEYWLNLQLKMDLWNAHYGSRRADYLEIQRITAND